MAGWTKTADSGWTKGSTRAWRRLREAVLQAEPLCRECRRAGRRTPAVEVDHITPRSRGGQDAIGNLMPVCHACHRHKTLAESAQAQGHAPPRRRWGCDVHGFSNDPAHPWRTEQRG